VELLNKILVCERDYNVVTLLHSEKDERNNSGVLLKDFA
jgi:hypothetical protein